MTGPGGPGTTTRPDRFPGFDVTGQARHWDRPTADLVLSRLRPPGRPRFHRPPEASTARALLALLLDLDGEVLDQVLAMIDNRLADRQTDGWHFEDMPEDSAAWRESLHGLDDDASGRHGRAFADCPPTQQGAIVAAVRARGPVAWHGLDASHIWGLWTRYACTAYYAHPAAWTEIGFPGPAYPRGYANLGVDALEHHEVADAHPEADPAASGQA